MGTVVVSVTLSTVVMNVVLSDERRMVVIVMASRDSMHFDWSQWAACHLLQRIRLGSGRCFRRAELDRRRRGSALAGRGRAVAVLASELAHRGPSRHIREHGLLGVRSITHWHARSLQSFRTAGGYCYVCEDCPRGRVKTRGLVSVLLYILVIAILYY